MENYQPQPEWPTVFTDSAFEYPPNAERQAAADGCQGWGLCHARFHPPKEFGRGMTKIYEYLGLEVDGGDNLSKYADSLELTP